MTIIVHNKRTLRTPDGIDGNGQRQFRQGKPCRKCGAMFFYWGHDSEKPGRKWCSDKSCGAHGTQVSWIPLDAEKSPHLCVGTGTVPDLDPDEEEPEEAAVAVPAYQALAYAGANGNSSRALAGADVQNEAMRKLREALGLLAPPPELNAEAVKEIIAQVVPDMVADAVIAATLHLRPVTQVEIRNASEGTAVIVEGLTHKVFPDLLTMLDLGLNVFLPGPAGTGKSHMVRQAAEALGLPFFFISVGPTMLEHSLLGYMDGKGEYVPTSFYRWATEGGIFLLDEGDNGNAGVLNVLNSALGNRLITFPNGEQVVLPDDARCVVAANTNGSGPNRTYVGRQELDGAFLNRFALLHVPVDEDLERMMCLETGLDPDTVDAALRYVRSLRARIDRFNMSIVMGPRNSQQLCKLLRRFPVRTAVDMAVRKGMDASDWDKITADAPSLRA